VGIQILCFSCRPHNEFGTRASSSEISGVPAARFYSSDEPLFLPRNRFLRHCSDPPPSAPDFATAIGVLPALTILAILGLRRDWLWATYKHRRTETQDWPATWDFGQDLFLGLLRSRKRLRFRSPAPRQHAAEDSVWSKLRPEFHCTATDIPVSKGWSQEGSAHEPGTHDPKL